MKETLNTQWAPLKDEDRNYLVHKLLNDQQFRDVRKFIQDNYLDEVKQNVNKFLSMDFEQYQQIAKQINSNGSDSDEEFNPKDWTKKLKKKKRIQNRFESNF